MTDSQAHQRSPERRALDEQIAAEPLLTPPEVPTDAAAWPVEAHLGQQGRRPLAIAGTVEPLLDSGTDTQGAPCAPRVLSTR
jgi:hypothetical protein